MIAFSEALRCGNDRTVAGFFGDSQPIHSGSRLSTRRQPPLSHTRTTPNTQERYFSFSTPHTNESHTALVCP